MSATRLFRGARPLAAMVGSLLTLGAQSSCGGPTRGAEQVAAPAPSTPAPRRAAAAAGPAISDVDGDGLDVLVDHCPAEAEDFDLFQDDDGCPDEDDDHDGVLDETDACPSVRGSGERGCPAGCVLVSSTVDCWLSPLPLYEGAFNSLREIRDVLASTPEILAITLHNTRYLLDPEGSELRRLAVLRAYLISLGVSSSKIALRGGVTDNREASRGFVAYISKQRFEDGPFRETKCTLVGPLYKPARPTVSCPNQPSSP